MSDPQCQQLLGWYEFTHPSGAFEVCLRPGGTFWCPKFQANAKWAVTPEAVLQISWANYGNYELTTTSSDHLSSPELHPLLENIEFAGSLVGNPSDWRKMRKVRPLATTELAILGFPAGVGSEWEFEHAGGTFPVEFRGDGYSHFVCRQFPAHSHWSLGGAASDQLTINWDQYGVYELRLTSSGDSAEGCEKGLETNWRKMRFLRTLDASQAEQCNGHH